MLKNNSKEMRTHVETFIIEETAPLIYDDEQLSKWNEHVSALGLKGQTRIAQPDKSPIPFMHMPQALIATFETLCPRKVAVEDYDATPIPVEILDLIALSKREGYFKKIEIWYDSKSPDPACIGYTGDFIPISSPWEWHHKHKFGTKEGAVEWLESQGLTPASDGAHFNVTGAYLLGKWADVKATFEELAERARKRYVNEQSVDLNKKIRDAQRNLSDLELEAAKRFGLAPDASKGLPF